MPFHIQSRRTNPLTPLVAIAMAAGFFWLLGRRATGTAEAEPSVAEECLEGRDADGSCWDAGSPEAFAPATGGASATVLDPARVCPPAGYLCQGIAERSDRRVVRWADGTPEIRIRIPRPAGETSDVGLRLQQAAARGIGAWNGHPFPVRVVLSDRPGGEDFAVRWGANLGGRELGHVVTQWTRREEVARLVVSDFVLAARSPNDPSRTLDPGQVTLTAAHEMGHALGLPHSDSERDVMYPTNTARDLSVRDFRTMEALYSLENGAMIGPGG